MRPNTRNGVLFEVENKAMTRQAIVICISFLVIGLFFASGVIDSGSEVSHGNGFLSNQVRPAVFLRYPAASGTTLYGYDLEVRYISADSVPANVCNSIDKVVGRRLNVELGVAPVMPYYLK